MLEVDKSSSESDGNQKPTPFDLNIQITEEEIKELRDAFDIYKEEDGKIPFYDFFHHMEDHGIAFSSKREHQLVYGILRKIQKSKDLLGEGGRVDFDRFVELMKIALNQRKTRTHVRLIWNIFDCQRTGTITNHDIATISTEMGG